MIRPAVASDVVSIGKLWGQLVAFHRGLDQDMPCATFNGADLYARNLSSRLDDNLTQVFVAEEDGRIVGYVLGVVVDLVPQMFEVDAGGFLADIFVEETYRGRGIGQALVVALRDWFSANGLNHFEWHVSAMNAEALAFWDKLGGRYWQIGMRANVEGGGK